MEQLLKSKVDKETEDLIGKKATLKKTKKKTGKKDSEVKDDDLVKELIEEYEDENKKYLEKIDVNKKIIEALKYKIDKDLIIEERKKVVGKIIKLIEKNQKIKAMKLKLRLDVFDNYFSIQKTTLDDFNNIVNNIV